MAVTSLKMKAGSFRFFMLRDENLEDLAWDFIADLFQKNRAGNLIVLEEYFSGMDFAKLTDTDMERELRRLVSSKVDDNIFRYYGERDPSLKKIIRNLKLAIKERDCSKSVCYKQGMIVVSECVQADLALMPPEFMQIRLCERLGESMMIPDILIEVIDILDLQEEYRKQFPLVTLAAIIRESFVLLQDARKEKENPQVYSDLLEEELDIFLGKSISKVKDDLLSKYLKRGKGSREELDIYFKTAGEIVKSDFSEYQKSLSQFEELKKRKTDLEYDQFREKHRSLLEYVVKLVREDLLHSFKKDWVHFKQ